MGYLRKWFASPIKFREGMAFFGSRRNQAAEILQQFGMGITAMPGCLAGTKCETGSLLMASDSRLNSRRRFSNSPREEQPSSRNWLARLWVEERRRVKVWNGGVKRQSASNAQDGATLLYTFASQLPFLKLFPYQLPFFKSIIREPDQVDQDSVINKTMHHPKISQYDGDFLPPSSPEEVKLAPLLSRDNLVIIRDIEWASIMFAFEQESRYVVMDVCYPQSPVAFIRERSNVISRQLLRGRRPFVAHMFDAMGNEVFRVHRPFWWINSTIYAEVDGKEIGVVHRRWHLWRRIYDLYLGNKQFAVVENPGFWNWTFTLKDENGNVLAQIDRNWRGIGLELFTDAGQYVIRFGDADSLPHTEPDSIQEFKVARPLSLSERAITVALAISLDNDYFSTYGGWGLPFLVAGE
ncbi:altered inheritance rate of mitochondria protein 25-like [Zingiber officinale]|uniref:Phospholipid scramblase n=1 Tax=Zingiber officinale TaxID=94328 RepID=A0A8J5GVA4_ZINOF|nr:altered inheritance rate of mitochondria protein 25-like [Zingiber officinale]KAG6506994.1 hypothetical protein ZIOFF_032328 [Zingiber officinale]